MQTPLISSSWNNAQTKTHQSFKIQIAPNLVTPFSTRTQCTKTHALWEMVLQKYILAKQMHSLGKFHWKMQRAPWRKQGVGYKCNAVTSFPIFIFSLLQLQTGAVAQLGLTLGLWGLLQGYWDCLSIVKWPCRRKRKKTILSPLLFSPTWSRHQTAGS